MFQVSETVASSPSRLRVVLYRYDGVYKRDTARRKSCAVVASGRHRHPHDSCRNRVIDGDQRWYDDGDVFACLSIGITRSNLAVWSLPDSRCPVYGS